MARIGFCKKCVYIALAIGTAVSNAAFNGLLMWDHMSLSNGTREKERTDMTCLDKLLSCPPLLYQPVHFNKTSPQAHSLVAANSYLCS